MGATTHQVDWHEFDVLTPDEVRIEVKSSAYVQAWTQKSLSRIVFSRLKARRWDPATGESSEATYNADVYVFCLQTATTLPSTIHSTSINGSSTSRRDVPSRLSASPRLDSRRFDVWQTDRCRSVSLRGRSALEQSPTRPRQRAGTTSSYVSRQAPHALAREPTRP